MRRTENDRAGASASHRFHRADSLREQSELRKKPSTSELIDWICALKKANVDLSKVGHGIPFLGTLLKTESGWKVVAKTFVVQPRAR